MTRLLKTHKALSYNEQFKSNPISCYFNVTTPHYEIHLCQSSYICSSGNHDCKRQNTLYTFTMMRYVFIDKRINISHFLFLPVFRTMPFQSKSKYYWRSIQIKEYIIFSWYYLFNMFFNFIYEKMSSGDVMLLGSE